MLLSPAQTQQMFATGHCAPARQPRQARVACCAANSVPSASSRRIAISSLASLAATLSLAVRAPPGRAADEEEKALCNAACASELALKEKVTTPSGLQFHDIVVGTGPTPPVGFQVVVNYVAMTPAGRVFASSLERGAPYDLRVGAGQLVPGLDEGLQTMQVGGVRRLYIPGNLAFPKGLTAAAGRPRVPPASPVIFDVQLLYIPGLE